MSQAHGLPALALSLSCVTASESQSLLQPQCPHPKSGDWNTLRGGDDLCKHWVSARHTENSRTVSSPRCRCLSRAPALQPQVREDSGSEQPSLAPQTWKLFHLATKRLVCRRRQACQPPGAQLLSWPASSLLPAGSLGTTRGCLRIRAQGV